MKQKWWKIVVAVIAIIGVAIVIGLILGSILNQKTENTETTVVVQDEAEYGYVDEMTVVDLITNLNQVIMTQDDAAIPLVDSENVTVYQDNYWFSIDEDISLVIVPVSFSDNKDQDIVSVALVYLDQDSTNQDRGLEYLRYLIQANDNALDAEEIEKLVTEAEDLRERGEMANHGQGIFVAIHDTDNHVEYQVVRNYRADE